MIKLTARQQEVLDLIKQAIDATGMPPTRAEIAKELGFRSANAAEEHLKALARKGAIEMVPGASRGIRVVGSESGDEGLPLIGRVAAGSPILAQEHIEDHLKVPSGFFKPEAHYLLEVHGDSMMNVGIMDGDLLAVHRTTQANNGDIVVARVGEEVTVKRFKQVGDRISLIAENDDYLPIEVTDTSEPFAIEGLYVGVIRRH